MPSFFRPVLPSRPRLRVLAPLLGAAFLLGAAKRAPLPPHTSQVVQGIAASFAGEPSRAQLLAGGLAALERLAPGTVVKLDDGKPGRISFSVKKRKLAFDTEDMVADSEVVDALQRAAAAAAPGVSAEDLDDALASGVVHALGDRHSSYLKATYVKRLGYTAGELLGDPGIDLDVAGRDVKVRSVAPGSSAALAGIQAGQLLKRIDKQDVDGLSLGELGALLLGQSGTHVTLLLEPTPGAKPWMLDVARDPPYALQPHIRRVGTVLHVVPGPLLGNAHTAIREALEARGDATGVVLDLRGNGGGQVGDAVALVDLFVGAGPTAQVVGRPRRPVQRYECQDGDPGEGLGLVVLMDGRTASASELVAMVLRERRGVKLLGSRSYGKGSVQKLLPIDGGGYLKITAGYYQTATGASVGEGLEADQVLDAALVSRRGQEGDVATDGWLRLALEALAPAH